MMYRIVISIVLLLFSLPHENLMCDSQNRAPAASLTPEKLLKKYRDYLMKYDNVEITEDMSTSISLPGRESAGLSLTSNIYLTKDRVKYEIQEYGNVGKLIALQGEFVFDQNMELLASFSKQDARLSVIGDKSDNPSGFSERLKNVYGKLFFGVGYFGWNTPHNIESVFDILDHSRCNFDITYLDSSRELIRMEAKTDKFTVNFWFDTKHNGPPYKITYDRPNASLYFDEIAQFSLEVKKFRLTDDIYVPSEMVTHYVDYSSKKPIKNEVVIKDGKFISNYQPQKLILDNAVRRQVTQKVDWSNVQFHGQAFPDSVFKLEKLFVIPDYTPVNMKDAPQIEYIWHDGKIVPKTDEVMLAIAQGGHKFMPGPESPRFWFMAIGILLMLFGGGKMTYDHFKKK